MLAVSAAFVALDSLTVGSSAVDLVVSGLVASGTLASFLLASILDGAGLASDFGGGILNSASGRIRVTCLSREAIVRASSNLSATKISTYSRNIIRT